MEDPLFRCRHCNKIRRKRKLGREQSYCGSEVCQKARNNTWRRAKYEVDPDYRANQRASTKAWLASQGGSAAYYRGYRKRRKKHRRTEPPTLPANTEHTALQEVRPPATAARANSNAEMPQSRVTSGRYRLLPCDTANRNAILVELTVIPDA